MSNFSKFLRNSLKIQDQNIQSYQLGDGKVWLKKASERHSAWIYLPLKWVARILNIEALTPIPNYGGSKSIYCEVHRLTELNSLGIPTPQILANCSQGLLIEDVADHGEDVMQLDQALAEMEGNTAKKLEFYREAIFAIQSVHHKDSYLSEAFARNILVNKDKAFTFIDFETDPGEVLDLETCQIRDWLCFIFSTAFRFNDDELAQACDIFIGEIYPSKSKYNEICRIGNKLNWVANFNLGKLGSDGRKMQKCLEFFQYMKKNEPLPLM